MDRWAEGTSGGSVKMATMYSARADPDSTLLEFPDVWDDLVEEMTADGSLIWRPRGSPAGESSLGYPVIASPGKNSVQDSSVSPGTLILTPTSSTLPEFSGDVLLFEDAEASDASTSPESSFTHSSDEHVDHSRQHSQPGGRRNVTMRPQPASTSGVAQNSTRPPPASGPANTIASSQYSSYASLSSAGTWMDDQMGGQWGQLDASGLFPMVTTADSFETDVLSDINPLDGASFHQDFGTGLPFRAFDDDGQFFAINNYPSLLQQQQSSQGLHNTTVPQTTYAQHRTLAAGLASSSQNTYTLANTLSAIPSHLGHVVPRHTRRDVVMTDDVVSAHSSLSSSPTFGAASRQPAQHLSQNQVQRSLPQQDLRQTAHQHTHARLTVPPNAHHGTQNRQIQPLVPGRRVSTAQSVQADRRGGRRRNTRLDATVREKSGKMRKTGACWRCAFQRDQVSHSFRCTAIVADQL
jgi:hypothetical protein